MLQCVQGHVLVRSLPACSPNIALLLLAFVFATARFLMHGRDAHDGVLACAGIRGGEGDREG